MEPTDAAHDLDGAWHRRQAIAANNATWELLEPPRPTADDVDELLARAYAAAFHWARAADRTPANAARASWLLSRCHAVLGHGELALHHADRCAFAVADAGLDDFDLAYAHEARARALALLGRVDEAAAERSTAAAIAIADDQDRAIFDADLESEPWFGVAGTAGSDRPDGQGD